jgi:Leucine-rich repeat (LRR) protein
MKPVIYLTLAFIIIITGAESPAAASQVTANNFSCDDIIEIPSDECEALVALYQTNGPNWNNHENWLETDTPHNWWGVTVMNNHVVSLSLAVNKIDGRIPPEIGNYQSWFGFRLEYFVRSDSAELGKLHKLETLDLIDNYLSGSLPPEIGNLKSLKSLILANNRLTGSIPPEIGNLSNLR